MESKKRKYQEEFQDFLTCIVCDQPSRHIFIQSCAHVICFSCKWRDLNSARGFLNVADIDEKDRPFQIAKTIWGIDFIHTVKHRHSFEIFWKQEPLPLIGCPICKESCPQNQMNIFSLSSWDVNNPPIVKLDPQPGDVKTCWSCHVDFDPRESAKNVSAHLFRECKKISFPCPLHPDCTILNDTFRTWMKKEYVLTGRMDVLRQYMGELLFVHLFDGCLIPLTCPYCLEVFPGTLAFWKHQDETDCQSLQRLNQVTTWLKSGSLPPFYLSGPVAKMYRNAAKEILHYRPARRRR